MRVKSARLFVVASALAALAPFASPAPATVAQAGFPGWPSALEGRPLRAIALTGIEQEFAASFPGQIGRFSDGEREVVMRWIATPTRKLHPAADCFKSSGYRVKPLPLETVDARTWGSFSAERGDQRLHVREVIIDGSDRHWTDVSAWYWAAVRGVTRAPWLAVTVAASEPGQSSPSTVPLGGAE